MQLFRLISENISESKTTVQLLRDAMEKTTTRTMFGTDLAFC